MTFLNIIELILVCLKLMELESTYFFLLKKLQRPEDLFKQYLGDRNYLGKYGIILFFA